MHTDTALQSVVDRLRALDPDGAGTAQVLRETFDQIYDGQRSGRYSMKDLAKTERTHIGTLVEINMQRHFRYDDGLDLDFSIGGEDVDCKYSMRMGGWMIPIEAQGKLCLLIHAEDSSSKWSLGVVRADLDILGSPNRDRKRTILSPHMGRITWLFRNAALPENTLLLLPGDAQEAIASCRPGTSRVAELMRRCEGRLVNRASVEAAAQQKDSMKRARWNGGAGNVLGFEGYLLLSGTHVWSRQFAGSLGLPVPDHGFVVPVRLSLAEPGSEEPTATFRGVAFRRWRSGDPVLDVGEAIGFSTYRGIRQSAGQRPQE